LVDSQDQDFVYLKSEIEIINDKGNVLTAFIEYKFSDVHLSMAL